MNINKHLFAAYCGMIKSGYDLMDLSDTVVSDVCAGITGMDFGKDVVDYFLYAKTNMVSVNPYYPRGSDLSVACFFQNSTIDKYINFLHMCESPEADNEEFIAWIRELPDILKVIENHRAFENIYQYYRMCLEKRFAHVSKQMIEIEESLKLNPFNSGVSIVFAPNLLQAKFLADYALVENTLFVISGIFMKSAVIHEYLHIVMKPIRDVLLGIIQKHGIEKFVDVNYMIKLGYMRGNTNKDKAHTLEECVVRAVCGVVDKSLNVNDYCHENVQSGFIAVPGMIENISNSLWEAMSLEKIILKAVDYFE